MFLTKLKIITALRLAVGVAVAGVAGTVYHAPATESEGAKATSVPKAAAKNGNGPLLEQVLTEATYEKWRDYVLPKPDEHSWQKIPWRLTFWAGVVEAQQKDRPILLWSPAGNPYACT